LKAEKDWGEWKFDQWGEHHDEGRGGGALPAPLPQLPAVLQIQLGSSAICSAFSVAIARPPENAGIAGYKVSKLSISIKQRLPAKLYVSLFVQY